MSNDHKSYSLVSKKLRELGLVPTPRLWVTPEELEIIKRITKRHMPTVIRAKEEAQLEKEMFNYKGSYW
jgi:hypothetical protein